MNPVSQFVAIALALTFSVLAVLLWVLLRKSHGGNVRHDRQDQDATRIYREELHELQTAREAGFLSSDDFENAREDIAVRLLQDVPIGVQTMQAAPGVDSGQRAVVSAVLVALLFPVLGGVLYLTLGDPMAVAESVSLRQTGNGAPDFVAMAQGLKEKLKVNPNDVQGWTLLGRTYRNQDQFEAAIDAFDHAIALNPDDRIAVERVEAIAAKNGGKFAGEPWAVLRKILAKDPDHANALLLAGSAAFTDGQFQQAIAHWTRLRKQLADASPEAQAVDNGLRAAAEKAGIKLAPAQPGQSPASGPSAQAIGRITGRVTLSDAMRAQTQASDIVFIYAQAEQGSPMPLAIMRTTVQALPLDFTLDDSMAMSPQAKLSGEKRVTVKARVAKSGQAMPQPGDLIGSVPHVAVGAQQVHVNISETIQ